MHTTHSNKQYKNESKYSEMGPVRQNPIQRTVRNPVVDEERMRYKILTAWNQ